MTTTELEQAILTIIKEVYCANYISKLKVTELTDNDTCIGYTLQLSMNNINKPIFINIEGDEKAFLKAVRKELSLRHLNTTTYSLGYMINGEENRRRTDQIN